MSVRHLSLKPRAIKKLAGPAEAWRYEERGGMTIVVDDGNHWSQFRISTRLMREYLKRLDKPPKS